VLKDQYTSRTVVDNHAESLLRHARHPGNGIFYDAGRSCLSRYECAVKMAESFGYSTRLVQPVFSSEFEQLATRPKNTYLQVERAQKTLGMTFLTTEEGVMEMMKQEPSQSVPSA